MAEFVYTFNNPTIIGEYDPDVLQARVLEGLGTKEFYQGLRFQPEETEALLAHAGLTMMINPETGHPYKLNYGAKAEIVKPHVWTRASFPFYQDNYWHADTSRAELDNGEELWSLVDIRFSSSVDPIQILVGSVKLARSLEEYETAIGIASEAGTYRMHRQVDPFILELHAAFEAAIDAGEMHVYNGSETPHGRVEGQILEFHNPHMRNQDPQHDARWVYKEFCDPIPQLLAAQASAAEA